MVDASTVPPRRPGGETARKPLEERLSFLKGMYVRHPEVNGVLAGMEFTFREHNLNREPYCAFFAGPTGVGKSTAIDYFIHRHPRQDMGTVTHAPVIYASAPPSSTPVMVAREVLKAFREPFKRTGSIDNLVGDIYKLFESCGTQMLILDEINNCLDSGTDYRLRNTSEWIKELISSSGVSVVLFGRPEAVSIFSYNRQLNRRVAGKVSFDRFHWRDASLRAEFRAFLAAVDRQLPVAESSNLHDEDTAARIYAATGGVSDFIMKLLRGATRCAWSEGKPHIEHSALSSAFTLYVSSSHYPSCGDPFRELASPGDAACEVDDALAGVIDPLARNQQDRTKRQSRSARKANQSNSGESLPRARDVYGTKYPLPDAS